MIKDPRPETITKNKGMVFRGKAALESTARLILGIKLILL